MELLVVIGIVWFIVNLGKDVRIHNQKYFGTEREIQRDNPRVVENRRKCQELYKKYSKEWQ